MAAATTATTAPRPPQISHRDRRRRGPLRSREAGPSRSPRSARRRPARPARWSRTRTWVPPTSTVGVARACSPSAAAATANEHASRKSRTSSRLPAASAAAAAGDHPSQRRGAHDPEVQPLLLPEAVERRPHHQHARHDERHEPDDPEGEPASASPCTIAPACRRRTGLPHVSAAAGVLDALLALGDPRHHAAELLADPLDLVLLAAGLELLVPLAAALALGHPLLGEASRPGSR